MAYMQAPVAFEGVAPGRGASVRLPGSGAVNQSILPWRWAFQFHRQPVACSAPVNLGRSSAPEVETEILDNVGSYGRQLGRLGEALEVLVRRLPRSELTESELAAIEAFSVQMREIAKIKETMRPAPAKAR